MINNYSDLTAFLKRLSAPKQGMVRVFRGQTKAFPKMLPTALRSYKPKFGKLEWDAYTQVLAQDLLRQSPGAKRPEDIYIFFIWVNIIAQHYGPGTSYLDVSRSPDVALWFALHDASWSNITRVAGPPGPFDPRYDTVFREKWLKFGPAETGFLFVFDVPKWDGTGFPDHAQLIDLADAPAIFSSSARIRAQEACLIFADEKVNSGDLASLYVCEPIPLARPMTGAGLLSSASDALFPGPLQDNWYNKFLSLPSMTLADYTARRVAISRPWPVTVYLPTAEAAIKDLAGVSTTLGPLVMHTGSLKPFQMSPDKLPGIPWATYAIDAATPILLEMPYVFTTPPAASDGWNQGIVATDLAESVEPIELRNGRPAGRADLRNVLFEFSPLERGDWERMENKPKNSSWFRRLWAKPDQTSSPPLIRALWLMRNQSEFVVHLIHTLFPQQQLVIDGPIIYRLDATASRLQYRNSSTREWAPVNGSELATKHLFVSLALLRAASPGKKADPFPAQVTEANTPQGRTFVQLREQAARLVRIAGEGGENAWYVLKEARADQPFFFHPATSAGALEFQGPTPWSQLDPREIRAAARGSA
jgi:hypothetical protein